MAQIKQNETVSLWMLYYYGNDGTQLEAIFTHKVQAEAALRLYKADDSNPHRWRLVERETYPHDNNC